MSDINICPVSECGRILEQKWDNVGFTEPAGPSKWECHLVCAVHGEVDPVDFDNENN